MANNKTNNEFTEAMQVIKDLKDPLELQGLAEFMRKKTSAIF